MSDASPGEALPPRTREEKLKARLDSYERLIRLDKPIGTLLLLWPTLTALWLAAWGKPPLHLVVIFVMGTLLMRSAGCAFNDWADRRFDAHVKRTAGRPLPRGEISALQTLVFACAIGAIGLGILYFKVNTLTMWLTLATFVGYAIVYTVLLKPATPQNIVIGGASGAMPPVLGWAAVANDVAPEALLLFLIIFVWTPPHFWSLALYRVKEYAKAGLPMLPVTHGPEYTRLMIVLYTAALFAVTLLPFAIRMSGVLYLAAAVALGATFLGHALALYRRYSDALARRTFRFSILYLAALFSALLLDHYWPGNL